MRVEDIRVETTLYSLTDGPPALEDRRSGDRHVTLLRVGSLMIGNRRELCLIKNISPHGMQIRAYCAIAPGTRLSVELKCGQSASGTARWADGSSVGIKFDRSIDIVDLLSASSGGPRPRMPRVEIDCSASVRHEADIHRVRAVNVSQGGIRVTSARALQVGSQVTVSLPGLAPQLAIVRWNEGGCYGISFSRVIPLQLLVPWLQEQQARLRAAS